ncbi:sensor histidine kinase [Spirosoma foliorum]|uniref:Sensor histidine kinase n=1 Tax=Spirosoma foliorum TaxID=2710596 RepID=A0A7G5H2U8_9BACT|nr:sensor histidine kinase [Spirosoma foliorum]QMW05440.1 sensor histidine kinase [Spirosoma foliorum]
MANKPFFFELLVNSRLLFRLIRYGLLLLTGIFLIYRGFHYLATTIIKASSGDVWRYSIISTIFFGSLIAAAYWVITILIRNNLLLKFNLKNFSLGLFLVHLVASELVLTHFYLFYAIFPIEKLPGFYKTYAEHIKQLPFWMAPFDRIVVWLFSFSLFYNYLLYAIGLKVFKDLFTAQLRSIELEKDNLRLEFDFLKAQINPHFLFNTLNNIYSFSIRSPEKVPNSILKLSDLMRYTLYETNDDQVLLIKEIAFLTSYIDLQRIRHDDHVTIQFIIMGQPTNQVIPPLLLIVFIENAFKHGIQATAKSSWVDIRLSIQPHTVSLYVDNSIPNIVPETQPGLGLRNVQKRLAHFFPHLHTLSIEHSSHQFSIKLSLDLHENALSSDRVR